MTVSELCFATQAASLSALPLWSPLSAKSIYDRTQMLEKHFVDRLSNSPKSNFCKDQYLYFRGFQPDNKPKYFSSLKARLFTQPLYPLTDLVLTTLLQDIKQVNQRDPNVAERLSAGFITGAATAIFYTNYTRYERVTLIVRNGTFFSCLLVATPMLQRKIDRYIPGSGKAHSITTMTLASAIPASIYSCVATAHDLMAIMRQSDQSPRIQNSAFAAVRAALRTYGKATLKTGSKALLGASIVEMTTFNLFKNFYLDKC